MGKIAGSLAILALFTFSCAPARPDWLPTVPHGFHVESIANVPDARELAAAPNGDLFAGTKGDDVYIIPHAEKSAGHARIFVHVGDAPAAGVALSGDTLYIATQHAVWSVAYHPGDLHARSAPVKIASVRTGEPPPGSDGDVHSTTSVTSRGKRVFASVGSSCNACAETDPTRATVGIVSGGHYKAIAKRIRNAVALAVNPDTDSLWAGDVGQDELPAGHPYEFLDDVTAHAAPADYGWPSCYENRKQKPGTSSDCSNVAIPRVILPAYESPMGLVFYPQRARGKFAFPAKYAGGAFVTFHGSWHGPAQGLYGYMPPLVAFVPMRGDRPARAADWNDPSKQWDLFAGGYQQGRSIGRAGRPTGIAVGAQGSLFVADDQTGAIYRIRPD